MLGALILDFSTALRDGRRSTAHGVRMSARPRFIDKRNRPHSLRKTCSPDIVGRLDRKGWPSGTRAREWGTPIQSPQTEHSKAPRREDRELSSSHCP